MALDPKLLEILACPEDKGPLLYFADEDTLYNPRLKRRYRVLDGDIPDLLIDDSETVDAAEDTRLTTKAETDGVTCVPHAFFIGPGFLATLHVIAAKACEATLERFFADIPFTPYAKTVPVTDGVVHVPETPGLGADPEPELIERYRIRA